MLETTNSTVERLARNFDHHDPQFDPEIAAAVHRAIREERPVAYSQAYGGIWILSRYEHVMTAFRDHETFRSGAGVFFPRAPGIPFFAPLEYDPPLHTAYRNLIMPAVNPATIERLQPEIDDLVAALVRKPVERGHGDLVAELAVPLPVAVVAMAVGFSDAARERVRELTANTWKGMPGHQGSNNFWQQFTALFRDEIARVRACPGDDYLSWLIRQSIDGQPIADEQLYVMLVSLSIAGHETTMNAASHLLWHLAANVECQDQLRDEPQLVSSAVEEALRLWTVVDHGSRVTTREVKIEGVTIPAGARVILLAGAANRDPRKFTDPENFRLDRGPDRHLSFGFGIHFCVGAKLARIELESILRELIRGPRFHLDGDVQRYYENGRHMCMDQLPVRFEAAV